MTIILYESGYHPFVENLFEHVLLFLSQEQVVAVMFIHQVCTFSALSSSRSADNKSQPLVLNSFINRG